MERLFVEIDIETDDDDQRIMFYTALYHTGVQPNLFTDADGRYWADEAPPRQCGKSCLHGFLIVGYFRAYIP